MIFARLFLLFTIVPLVELLILGWLSARVGLFTTLLIVIVTGIVGAALARRQGLAVLAGIQSESATGRAPTSALIDGAMILVAGALLVTPGIVTDCVGFSLLVPQVRARLRRVVVDYFKRRAVVQVQTFRDRFESAAGGPTAGGSAERPSTVRGETVRGETVRGEDVIDVEYVRLPDPDRESI